MTKLGLIYNIILYNIITHLNQSWVDSKDIDSQDLKVDRDDGDISDKRPFCRL